jgi:arachidonate 15-lipoxygenase
MAIPAAVIEPWRLSDHLDRALHSLSKDKYRYKRPQKNALSPVCVADSFSYLLEKQDFTWISRFLPGYLRANGNLLVKRLLFSAQRVGFSFDLMRAYDQLFYGCIPEFVKRYDTDDAFAYRRIAGPNALEIRRVDDLHRLLMKIPIRSEALAAALGRPIDLRKAVELGRLFEVDFVRIQRALRPSACPRRTRDSRWRQKYLPAPIAVFLEAPGRGTTELVPLAIQIDQPQPPGEHNPVYYPDGGAAWKIAKLYFEVADQNSHFGCGHVYRTHFVMEPFCLATARQLAFEHPIHLLLRPHTRYTLATNSAAYKDFVDRKEIYFDFYAGTLEESRQILIESYKEKTFLALDLEAELTSRGVSSHLDHYPYRDDARLWRAPIRDFVNAYVRAFYACDASVRQDAELQAWAAELMDRDFGAVCGLVPDDCLDTIDKLVDLLAQVLFIAGPGHASQHFSEMYYYRYQPAFAAAAYAPPVWDAGRANEARFRNTLPPIDPGGLQFAYSDFGDFRYDRFGDYSQYPLDRVRQAVGPIRRLQASLERVELTIEERLAERMLRYDFLLPSRVPNSINI